MERRITPDLSVLVDQGRLHCAEHVQRVVFDKHIKQVVRRRVHVGEHISPRMHIVCVVKGRMLEVVLVEMTVVSVDFDRCWVRLFVVDQVGFVLPEPDGEEDLPALDSVHADSIEELHGQLHAHCAQHEERLRVVTFRYGVDDIELGRVVALQRRPRDASSVHVFALVVRYHGFEHGKRVVLALFVILLVVDEHDEEVRVVARVETRVRVGIEEADDAVFVARGNGENEVDTRTLRHVGHRHNLHVTQRTNQVQPLRYLRTFLLQRLLIQISATAQDTTANFLRLASITCCRRHTDETFSPLISSHDWI